MSGTVSAPQKPSKQSDKCGSQDGKPLTSAISDSDDSRDDSATTREVVDAGDGGDAVDDEVPLAQDDDDVGLEQPVAAVPAAGSPVRPPRDKSDGKKPTEQGATDDKAGVDKKAGVDEKAGDKDVAPRQKVLLTQYNGKWYVVNPSDVKVRGTSVLEFDDGAAMGDILDSVHTARFIEMGMRPPVAYCIYNEGLDQLAFYYSMTAIDNPDTDDQSILHGLDKKVADELQIRWNETVKKPKNREKYQTLLECKVTHRRIQASKAGCGWKEYTGVVTTAMIKKQSASSKKQHQQQQQQAAASAATTAASDAEGRKRPISDLPTLSVQSVTIPTAEYLKLLDAYDHLQRLERNVAAKRSAAGAAGSSSAK